MHPLLKTKAARVDILLSRNGDRVFFLPFSFCLPFDKRDDEEREKKKNEKKLPEIFGRYVLKFLPLHPLSEKNSNRKQAIFEQIYINNTSSTRAGASQINNWKLMIKARRTWVKQKNRQYLFYID